MTIDAVNYDGPFFFGLFAAADCPKSMDDETFRSYCSASWEEQKGLYSSFFETPEQGLHFIFNELAYYDKAVWEGELDANTEYVLWAFGMNSEAIINSTPVRHYFKTGGVAASDNTFTISFSDVKSRRATITIETSNDDTYVSMLAKSSVYGETTDDIVIKHIIENYNLSYSKGTEVHTMKGLTPNTEYEVLVFGCQAASPTTGLTRVKFNTADTEYAELDMSLEVNGYFDIEEMCGVDPVWENYRDYCDAMVVVSATVDANAVEYYFSALDASGFEYCDYEYLIEGLVKEGAAEDSVAYFPVDYDDELIFFGAAKDVEGNYTEICQTKPKKFTYDGRTEIDSFSRSGTRVSRASLVYAEVGTMDDIVMM